jgi:hypothetical protein
MQRFIIERSKDEFYTAHSGVALIGLFPNRYCNLGRSGGFLQRLHFAFDPLGQAHLGNFKVVRGL